MEKCVIETLHPPQNWIFCSFHFFAAPSKHFTIFFSFSFSKANYYPAFRKLLSAIGMALKFNLMHIYDKQSKIELWRLNGKCNFIKRDWCTNTSASRLQTISISDDLFFSTLTHTHKQKTNTRTHTWNSFQFFFSIFFFWFFFRREKSFFSDKMTNWKFHNKISARSFNRDDQQIW